MPEHVNWFVNRAKQFLGFQKMLARETPKAIMLIEAPAEMGKTWLIQRMCHHCHQNDIPAMHIDFRDRRAHDYLSLVRLARDQMGACYFNPLTEIINKFTSLNVSITIESARPAGPVDVSVGDISSISGGEVIVAGGDVIKDNQFYIQADSDMARRAAEMRINDAFFACLGLLLKKGPVVFLFDSYEDVTPEAEDWLRDHLLFRMGEEGQLPHALVIIAGRKTPTLGPTTKPLVARTGLDLFSEDHVREYILVRRGIEGLDLETIFKTCGGFPGLMAKMADVATMDAQDDDDWL